jgi:predicted glutamine amidotransferase
MCRLLGVVAREPASLADLLRYELGEFVALSAEHGDGWGVAAWSDEALASARNTGSARDDAGFAIATKTVSDAGLLHLRQANRDLPVTIGNTHPFMTDTLAFAHNGYFRPANAVDGHIGPELLATATGDTDSERFFLLIRSLLRDHDAAAAIATASALIRVQAAFASLNCLLLTHTALYAYAEEDPASEVSQRRGPDFFRLRYRANTERVVVGSSGLRQPEPDWHILPYGQVLEIRRSNLAIYMHPVPENELMK